MRGGRFVVIVIAVAAIAVAAVVALSSGGSDKGGSGGGNADSGTKAAANAVHVSFVTPARSKFWCRPRWAISSTLPVGVGASHDAFHK